MDLSQLLYSEAVGRGVLWHWSRRWAGVMDLHSYSVPMATAAVRLVLRRMADAALLPEVNPITRPQHVSVPGKACRLLLVCFWPCVCCISAPAPCISFLEPPPGICRRRRRRP